MKVRHTGMVLAWGCFAWALYEWSLWSLLAVLAGLLLYVVALALEARL